MRKALNENPMVQVAVIGLLIVVVGLVFMMNMGGGGGDDSASTAADSTPAAPITPTGATGAPAPTASSSSAAGGTAAVPAATTVPMGPEPPAAVRRAYEAGDTIVLLIIRPGGIEDRFVKSRVAALKGEDGVSVFIVPAAEIAKYSQLTQGLQVGRVPAMVVVSPKRLSAEKPYAQVHYGYLSRESVIQAVHDAEYEGQPGSYGPE